MNDPRYPYHAISYYDAFGNPPFVSGLPREEDDFASKSKAAEFLRERGGGTIERCLDGHRWELIASILPEIEGRILSA